MAKRVMLAWEQGKNLGHLSRLCALATMVTQHGGEPVWVVPASRINDPQLVMQQQARFSAPVVESRQRNPGERTDSYADILISLGLSDAGKLISAVKAWIALFKTLRPDRILLDYAPIAQLAAHIVDLEAYQLTNGFDAPPRDCPIFGATVRGPYLDRQNAQKVAIVSDTIRQVGLALRGRDDYSLDSFLNHARKFYDCIPETDPYGPRAIEQYLGPVGEPPRLKEMDWPKAPAPSGKRVFAYLRGGDSMKVVVEALAELSCIALVVWPDAPDGFMEKTNRSPSVRIVRQPIDLKEVLSQADAVISYGPSGLVSKSVLSGKPQLIVPGDNEKYLVARKLASTGAALVWRPGQGQASAAIEELLSNFQLAQSAIQISSRYPATEFSRKLLNFSAVLAG